MVWSPLAGGFLSGKYTRDGEGEGRRATSTSRRSTRSAASTSSIVLRERGSAQGPQRRLSSRWLAAPPKAVSSVIIGAKRPDQLADNLGAVDVAFSAEELARLDAVSKLAPEYPGWMIDRQADYRGAPSARR
jgi:aryl-alcohol dehydrogenase-like predicted oxidoreductase